MNTGNMIMGQCLPAEVRWWPVTSFPVISTTRSTHTQYTYHSVFLQPPPPLTCHSMHSTPSPSICLFNICFHLKNGKLKLGNNISNTVQYRLEGQRSRSWSPKQKEQNLIQAKKKNTIFKIGGNTGHREVSNS